MTPRSSAGAAARLHADEEAAVADQRDALLLEHGTVGDRVPAGRGLCGEVGAEAAHELLVLGPGQSGDPPAAVLGERDDVAPDRACGPGHEQAPASAVAEQVDQLGCGQAVERDRGCRGQVETVGHEGGVDRRDDELLGVGAEVAVEPIDQPGDAAADREVDVRAGGGDGAGEVPAQAGVVGLVDQPEPVEHAGGERQVDGVDRGPGDLDPDLARPGLDDGYLDDLDGVGTARGADDSGAEGGGHVRLLWTHQCCSTTMDQYTLQWEVGTLKCVTHRAVGRSGRWRR